MKLPQFQLMDVPFRMCALVVANLFMARAHFWLCIRHTSLIYVEIVFMALVVFALQGLAKYDVVLCARSTSRQYLL